MDEEMNNMCEECGVRPATIRLGIMANGERQEKRLCPICMAKMPGLNIAGIAGALTGILGGRPGDLHKAMVSANEKGNEKYAALTCYDCGMTYEQYKKSGKVGCAGCYKAFEEPIKALLGGKTHVGSFPKGSALSDKLELERLRARLRTAIEAEEYEEAAGLRDMIRTMEANIDG